jgi:hypothetical protein
LNVQALVRNNLFLVLTDQVETQSKLSDTVDELDSMKKYVKDE